MTILPLLVTMLPHPPPSLQYSYFWYQLAICIASSRWGLRACVAPFNNTCLQTICPSWISSIGNALGYATYSE